MPGYRDEPDVRPDSNTETYAAVKLWIDNWRWADVPFYLRTGKRLAHKNSEIAIRFRSLPHRLFGDAGDNFDNNVLVMKIQPEEGISLRFNAKVPGPKMHIRSVSMDFNYGTGFGVVSAPAYERLIGDAMRGDATLFTRWDAVETAWQIVMPVLDRWLNTTDESFPNYSAGSQGPPSADRMIAMDGPGVAQDMNLESSTVSTSLDAIRGELARTKLSTSTLNFIVWIDDPARRDWIVERAGMLSEKHPSFTLILDHSGSCAASAATVTTSPRDPQSTITVDSERVDIDVCGADAATVVGYVTGLTQTNVPTVLWWSGIKEDSAPIFHAVLPLVTTLLVDSSGGTRDDTALRTLVAFHAEHPEVALRDLAWLRLRPWQDMIANFFDDPDLLGELFSIRALHIASGSDSEALYLGGWLASRAGLDRRPGPARSPTAPGKRVAFQHERDGDIRRVRSDLPRQRDILVPRRGDRGHAVVKVWVEGEHAREPRLFPLQAIDNASLLKRAVLEPGTDELFETALTSAGTLLG